MTFLNRMRGDGDTKMGIRRWGYVGQRLSVCVEIEAQIMGRARRDVGFLLRAADANGSPWVL